MIRAHRIALDPNKVQVTYFRKACGTARFAYNWALAEWNKEREAGGKPDWMALARKLNAIKRTEFPWMLEVGATAASCPIRHLGRAFQSFFRKTRKYPQFKKKGERDRFHLPAAVTVFDGAKVRISVLGWVKMQEELRFSGKVYSTVISYEGGRWFLSVNIDSCEPIPQSENQAGVGVDLGITALATLSNGEKVEGPKPHRALTLRLRRMNKSLSRKVKGSSNREKAKRKLSRLHARIGNIRKDALHQLTHRLTRDFGVIGIENLNVAGIVRNKRAARSISDMGFYEFKRQLKYKAAWRGVRVVEVDRFYPSSKTCSACGLVAESLPLSIRSWTCPCGAEHDRDINAAINILAAGMAVSACGDSGAGQDRKALVKLPSMKQEPTRKRKDA
jgi:putative transposase